MPHVSGHEVYARMMVCDPDQAERFVFITGGAVNPRLEAFLAAVPNERLEKPFSPQHLRAVARRFVRSSAASGT